jgi:hypothetical protein
MLMITYKPIDATMDEFVTFWSQCYGYNDENIYDENIKGDINEEKLMNLFKWKNGFKLSNNKEISIKKNFIARIDELSQIPKNADPKQCLERFMHGGAIWRIFFLHCWNYEAFPIYDQHVHRAMEFIQKGSPGEIPSSDKRKIDSYLNKYIPFHEEYKNYDQRMVDKALWAFGKFLKENKKFCEISAHRFTE